ncbi:MAG: hypothetical protein HOI95_13120 [Chromatiales bacterium]|nr:hypothetical protein [Chromatiales bacterium]
MSIFPPNPSGHAQRALEADRLSSEFGNTQEPLGLDKHSELSQRLTTALGLKIPPVAVTFMAHVSTDVPGPTKPAPAGCSFWQVGAATTIATSAEDHKFCAIGVHTHNLQDASPSHASELGAALTAMKGLDYVRPAEVEALPVMGESHKHVVYGPLSEADDTPNVVLLFAHATQSLILTEAVARIDGNAAVTLGRPACALIPQVVNTSRSAMSLGCCGARAYLHVMSEEIALWGLCGDKLASYVEEIETLAKANTILTQFHAGRKTAIDAGQTPTFEESLAALHG